MTAPLDLAAIRERHRRWVPRHECRICNQPWPCDAIQLAADNERLREAMDALGKAYLEAQRLLAVDRAIGAEANYAAEAQEERHGEDFTR